MTTKIKTLEEKIADAKEDMLFYLKREFKDARNDFMCQFDLVPFVDEYVSLKYSYYLQGVVDGNDDAWVEARVNITIPSYGNFDAIIDHQVILGYSTQEVLKTLEELENKAKILINVMSKYV